MRRYSPCLAAFLLIASELSAQEHSTRTNPFNKPADRAAGGKLFRTQCAPCHGPDGAGGAGGPEFVTGTFRHGHSDEALYQSVVKGIPGTNMPAFPGSAREAWQLVAYVRSLSAGKAAATAKGDRERGAALFEKSGCRGCHWFGDAGGSLGPDLTAIGLSRSLGQLRRSIVAPEEEVAPEFWVLRARTPSGADVSGIRLNEDTFSYQYRDGNTLRSVQKADLAEHRTERTSLMPSYAGKLTPDELEDILAFIATPREGAAQ